jgi:hypothetical protein
LRSQQTLEDFDEVDKLRTWYEYFQKSYHAMEKEIERRRIAEERMHQRMQALRAYLASELMQEQGLRI